MERSIRSLFVGYGYGYHIAFVFICFVAVILRFYGLADSPYVLDEPFTATLAEVRAKGVINPAYYNLVVWSHYVLGSTEFSTRLPAAMLGVIGVVAIGFIGLRLGGRRVALAVMLITALSSWHIWHSQYARFYSGVFLCAVLAYYFHFLALKNDNIKYLFLSLIAGILAALFHTMAVIVLGVTGLCSIIWLIHTKGRNKTAKIHLALGVVGVLLVAFPLFEFAQKWQSLGQTWGASPFKLMFKIARDSGVVLLSAGVLGIYFVAVKDRLLGLIIGLAISVPIVLVCIISIYMPIRTDYVIYILPVIIISVAFMIEHLCLERQYHAALSVLLIVLASMVTDTASHFSARATFDGREAVNFVESRYKQGDKVLSHFATFSYYSYGKMELEPWIGTTEISEGGWGPALRHYGSSDDTIWVIVSVQRTPNSPELESWLNENARLLYRSQAMRFDNRIEGVEVHRSSPTDRMR